MVSDFLVALITPTPPSFPGDKSKWKKQNMNSNNYYLWRGDIFTVICKPQTEPWSYNFLWLFFHFHSKLNYFSLGSYLSTSCVTVFSPHPLFSSQLPGNKKKRDISLCIRTSLRKKTHLCVCVCVSFILCRGCINWPLEGGLMSWYNCLTAATCLNILQWVRLLLVTPSSSEHTSNFSLMTSRQCHMNWDKTRQQLNSQ